MELIVYQKRAMQTCMDTSNNFSYMVLNLMAELGEMSGKIAKQIRKGKASIDRNQLSELDADTKQEVCKELGDVLWQLSGLCTVMGVSLEDIAESNLKKLADRQKRNVIDGNGDNR